MSTPETPRDADRTGPGGKPLTPEQVEKMAAFDEWARKQQTREAQIRDEIAELEAELETVKNYDVCDAHVWHDGTSAVYDGECLLCGDRP